MHSDLILLEKWPLEVDLKAPFEFLVEKMTKVEELIMCQIGFLGNPHWCGAHFDHGLFTVIVPAVYLHMENPRCIGACMSPLKILSRSFYLLPVASRNSIL